jgi:transposase, IS5 family
MPEYMEKYKRRFGFYPAQILADQIYCTRTNRHALKELGIKLEQKYQMGLSIFQQTLYKQK